MTTWTPKTQQSETWTSEAPTMRAFDPAGFAITPAFDTGSVAGSWTRGIVQAETWMPE